MTAQSLRQLQTYFNSRPSARGDAIGKPTFVMSVFQFTPLREGRRQMYHNCQANGYFNSRPSARGDATMDTINQLVAISIHAPPRGATQASRG